MPKAAYIPILVVWIGCSVQQSYVPREATMNEQPVANSPYGPCRANPDRQYTRPEMLDKFADVLSNTFRKRGTDYYSSHSYLPMKERPSGFFIYDLSDTTNHTLEYACIDFIENHVYHFSPGAAGIDLSHISHLADGELTTFTELNCEGKGDSIEDVVRYFENRLENNASRDALIERVRNYRKYGSFYAFDNYIFDPCTL